MSTPLLDSFKAGFAELPDALMRANNLSPLRRSALVGVLADGLPDHQTETWKYTPVRALGARAFALSSNAVTLDPALLAEIPGPRMVFVNGRLDSALSLLDALPEGLSVGLLSLALGAGDSRAVGAMARRFEGRGQVFARLNMAVALDGAHVQVAAGTRVEAPLHLVFVGAVAPEGDLAVTLRHVIELHDGASLTLVEHHCGANAHRHLHNHVAILNLKSASALMHVRVQDELGGASVIARTDAALAADARYRRLDLELGAGLSRHELNVSLQGERASLVASGVQLANERRHLHTHLGIEHVAGNTRSLVQWRSLADDRGRAVFHGGIRIRAGADGSDANLVSRNLLLSAAAEIDAQPVLEIYADEVKAAHGATVGQLDPSALFYLRSRGIPEAAARTLLTSAFCRDVLRVVEDAAMAEALAARVEAILQRNTAA